MKTHRRLMDWYAACFVTSVLVLSILGCHQHVAAEEAQFLAASGTIALSNPNVVTVSEDKRERLMFFEEGFEIKANRLSEAVQAKTTDAEKICMVELSEHKQLNVGQTVGVLVDYRYPRIYKPPVNCFHQSKHKIQSRNANTDLLAETMNDTCRHVMVFSR